MVTCNFGKEETMALNFLNIFALIWVRTAFNFVVMALKKLKIAEYNFEHGPNFNLHTTLIFISLLVVKTYFFYT